MQQKEANTVKMGAFTELPVSEDKHMVSRKANGQPSSPDSQLGQRRNTKSDANPWMMYGP